MRRIAAPGARSASVWVISVTFWDTNRPPGDYEAGMAGVP
jgi:hypothetical protein